MPPTRRELRDAMRTPGQHVVVFHPDGFELATARGLKAALADPDREVAILAGDGWDAFAHLSDPQQRLTEDRPAEPIDVDPEPTVEPSDDRRPAIRERKRVWDRVLGRYVWVDVTDDRDDWGRRR